MTRFARAKGSKSSNERAPNDATPWHVMKEQLTENLAMKQGSKAKVKTAKELLKEKEDPFYHDGTGNVNNDWAEFEQPRPKTATNQGDSIGKERMKKKKMRSEKLQEVQAEQKTSPSGAKSSDSNKDLVESSGNDKKIVSKRKVDQSDDNVTASRTNKKHKKEQNQSADVAVSKENTTNSVASAPKKLKKKEVSNKEPKEGENKNSTPSDLNNSQNNAEQQTENFQKLSKRQKRNMRKKGKSEGENSDPASKTFNLSGNDWNATIKETPAKKLGKVDNANGTSQTIDNGDGAAADDDQKRRTAQQFKKGPVKGTKDLNNSSNKFGKRSFDNGNPNNKRKTPKVRDDKEHKRRKPDVGLLKVTINGIEVEMVKYDGFPVRKEDADRLKDLKQQMIMKGIPKAEINAAMKLERRKAEKALTRIKKCVCFHCRKSGHNLSDCPELGSEQAATGICFKCGSTEHTHFECKVAKATEYRYATCFICREQGHLAKQCPDNPKGVYPQGGACKICGDVTHLKKDCPDLAKEKEETAITLDTIANDTVESLEERSKKVSQTDNTNPKKKVVKF